MALVGAQQLVSIGFMLSIALSMVLTGCFIRQYKLPKQYPGSQTPPRVLRETPMCPKHPEPVPLTHPVPALRDALVKVDQLLRYKVDGVRLLGLSSAIVYRDSVLWLGNFGKRNASDRASASPDEHTLYRIGGVSQLFPALLLALLWEQRRVASMDDSLSRYAPDFSVRDPFGDEGAPPVTLRRLCSHTSGLARLLRGTDLLWKGSTREALALLREEPLVSLPGARCHYSSAAVSLLAHVLAERVAGTDYETWLQQNVLRPMGMRDTAFHPYGHAADPGQRLAEGRYADGSVAPLFDLGWYRPAGQMFSSVADLAKLSTLFLGTSQHPLLTSDTVQMLQSPVQSCQADYFAAKAGLAWEILSQLGYTLLNKDGDIDGYAASLSIAPQLKLAFVLLIAGQRPQSDLTAAVYGLLLPALERALRGSPPRAARPPPSPRRYLGYYALSNATFYRVATAPERGAAQAPPTEATRDREARADATPPPLEGRQGKPLERRKRRERESGGKPTAHRPERPAQQTERQPQRRRKALLLQVFGPDVDLKVPEKFRTFQLSYLGVDVFRAEFLGQFPCVLEESLNTAHPVNLQLQDRQIVNFHHPRSGAVCLGFDIPALNIYNVRRLKGKPIY